MIPLEKRKYEGCAFSDFGFYRLALEPPYFLAIVSTTLCDSNYGDSTRVALNNQGPSIKKIYANFGGWESFEKFLRPVV